MWLPLLLALFTHPNSISSALIDIDEAARAIRVELRFDGKSIAELLPIDANQDGRLAAAEVANAKPLVAKYLLANYQLTAGGEQPQGGQRLKPSLKSLRLDAESLGTELATTWLVAEIEFTNIPEAIELLWVNCSLFLEGSPDHRNFARFSGPPQADWVFSAADPLWLIDLPGTESNAAPKAKYPWVQLGFEHILDGFDHLCFVLGILLAAEGLRKLAWAISSFTLAHSVSLGLVVFGVLPNGGDWAEILIAASIIFVGAANLIAGTPRRVWPEAFLFGLVHGLGFASALGDALGRHTPEASLIGPLFGFNLGIEIGQLGAAFLGVLVLKVATRWVGTSERIAKAGSLGIVSLGAYWLASRLFG